MVKRHRPKIIFIHIPKCGGVSLRKSLYDSALLSGYSKSEILIPGESHDLSFDKKYIDISSIDHYKVIGGHYFPHGIDESSLSFTFLREPIERFISHYYFFCYNKPDFKFCSDKTLSEMSQRELQDLQSMGNVLTRWLCGCLGENSHKASLDEAVDVLFGKIGVFGILSDMEKSILRVNEYFSNQFCLKQPLLLNRSGPIPKNENKSVLEALKLFNQMDIELFNQAQVVFNDRQL